MGKLRIVSWNANGVVDKKPELVQFLKDMDVDILLLQETMLRPAMAFNLPNYQPYRTDWIQGPRRRGGTAVYVHRRVPHRHVPQNMPDCEVTSVAVHFQGNELLVSSIYNPPSRALQPRQLDQLLQPGVPGLLIGDLNAKHRDWGCRTTNINGRDLRTYMEPLPHLQVHAPVDPTHFHHAGHRPDILDIGVSSSLDVEVDVFTVTDLSSDHVPVVFDLPDNGAPAPAPPLGTRKVNWVKYSNFLANREKPPPPPAEDPEQLDLQVASLTDSLQEAIEAASFSPAQTPRLPSLPQELRDEINLRRRLRRNYQRSRCPAAKAAFNRQARHCSRLLSDHRTACWEEFVDSKAGGPGGVWRVSRSLRGEKRSLRPVHGQRGLVYSPEGKAEVFAEIMEDQFSPNADVYNEEHCELVEGFLETHEPDADEDPPLPAVTEQEVAEYLRRLRPRKAPGYDSLGTPALQKIPPWVLLWIVNIFNSCLRIAHFPSPWKEARVIMIPKPGKDPLYPDNHRPISLLPVLAKVLERIILSRFPEEFFASIRTDQFGFRRGHSTTLLIRRVLNNISGALERKHHATSVLIDVSKAFDRVWHDGLLYKLASSPLPGRIWKLLRSYLQERRFHVSVGGRNSTVRPVTAGVPQGSVLGPILYLWYANDLPSSPRVQVSLYADDALFTATSANLRMSRVYVQRQLDLLQPWLVKWRIKANAEKCEAIHFTKSRRQADGHSLTLDRRPIPWKTSIKYLGVLLDGKLTMTPHVTRVCDLASKGLSSILPLLRTKSLPVATKVLLYKALLRPVLTYAAPAWYHLTSRTSRKKLLSTQSRGLRIATRSPWFVRNTTIRRSAGVPTIREFVTGLTTRLDTAAEESTWDHIRELLAEPVPQLRRPFQEDLQ